MFRFPGLAVAVQIAIGVVGLYFTLTSGVIQTPVGALPIWYWLFLLWIMAIYVPVAMFRGVGATVAGATTIGEIALRRGIGVIGWLLVAVAISFWWPNSGGMIALAGVMGVANLILLLICVRRLRAMG